MAISSLYLTPQELINGNTGINWAQMFAGDLDSALQRICQTVSSVIDNETGKFVFGPTKPYVLRCSQDTESAITSERIRTMVTAEGDLIFRATFRPVKELISMKYFPVVGHGSSSPTPTTVSDKDIYIEGRDVHAITGLTWTAPVHVEIEYINGLVNTYLGLKVEGGASTLTLTDPIGLLPGDELTIYDTYPERVRVNSTYVKGSTTVPLVNPVLVDHAKETRVSEMGSDLQQAAIWFAVDLIQSRGQQGAVAARQTLGTGAVPYGVTNFYYRAKRLLDNYILTP